MPTKRKRVLAASAVVAAAAAFAPAGAVQDLEAGDPCDSGVKQCAYRNDCIAWVGSACVKWGEWYWANMKP
jgi:hypothetical protein